MVSYGSNTHTFRLKPDFERPATRGGGSTLQRAEAELHLPGGRLVTKTREVDSEITRIIGLDRRQFTQIAMIAQGDFLKLLLADVNDRKEIFREIFKTRRYMVFQERVKEASGGLQRACEAAHASVRQFTGGVTCREDDPLLPALERAREGALPFQETVDLIRALTAQDEAANERQQRELDRLDGELKSAAALLGKAEDRENTRRKLEAARVRREEQRLQVEAARSALAAEEENLPRREALAKEKAALEAGLPRYQELALRQSGLAALDGQAAKLREALVQTGQARRDQAERLESARRELAELASAAAGWERLSAEQTQRENRQAALDTLVGDIQEWQDCGRRFQEGQARRAKLRAQQEELSGQQLRQGELLRASRETWSAAEGLEAEKAKLLHRQSQALERQKDLEGLTALLERCGEAQTALEAAQAAYRQAQNAAGEAETVYQRKNRAFLDEQAGLLAQGLEAGQPCPVCGSRHHPAPAGLSGHAPTEAELERAKADAESARQEASRTSTRAGERRAALEERNRQLLARMAAYVERPDLDRAAEQLRACLEETGGALDQLRRELVQLEARIIHREELGREIQRQEEQLQALTDRQERGAEALAQADVAQGKLQGQREQLEDKLRRQLLEQLGDCPLEDAAGRAAAEQRAAADGLAQVRKQLREAQTRLERKRELEALLPRREARLRELEQALSARQQELSGAESRREEIASQVQALRAELPCPDAAAAQAELAQLQAGLDALNRALEGAREALAARGLDLAGTDAAIGELSALLENGVDVDPEAQRARCLELEARRGQVAEAQKTVRSRRDANETALRNITKKAADLADLEREYAWVRALSNTVNGNLPGKEKVALETYIQAAFLDRILLRANLLLLAMSGGQYELKRRKAAADNRSQSGLELDVTDHYNGTERSVKSLSGGESFQASLSLALGLAGEIQSAAGGIRLDAMFVDEGFGSLDGEALQQAIRALTSLADENRLVGIISHVAELKEKIDKQIAVTKDRSGGSRTEIIV